MIKKISAILILCLLSAFTIENLISIQSNTLASHQSWYSFKKQSSPYFLGVMGGNQFLFERQSLAGQKLNLGVWFGYQDVLYKSPLPDFTSYRVNFSLETDKSYLWTYLNCDNDKCWALRLSANAEYPSGLYLITHAGEFVRHLPIEVNVATGSHSLVINKTSDLYEVLLDGHFLKKIEYAFSNKPIRFMGSLAPTNISKIEFTDITGKLTSLEFKTVFKLNRFLIIAIVLLILSFSIVAILPSKIQKWYISYASLMTIFLLAFLFYTFDSYYWSHLYLAEKMSPTYENNFGWQSKFEKYRSSVFVSEYDLYLQHSFLKQVIWFKPFQQLQQKDINIGINDFQIIDSNGYTIFKKDILRDIESINQKKYLKVAFVGGSQAWGAGATSLDRTWASLVIKDLAAKTKRKVIGINFSICGGVLFHFNNRADLINKFKPDLLIISFGANDAVTPKDQFRFQLKEFIKKINLAEVNTLFSIEALSQEYSNREPRKGRLMRNFTKKNQLNLVSLHEHFKSSPVVDSGNLWHDHVHFSDFGHIQASRFFTNTQVYKQLLASLNKSNRK